MMSNNYIAAYLRDSGGDDQDLSIAQQESEIRNWCQKNEFTLSRIFKDEARPGSSTVGRDAFMEMVQHFRAPNCLERGIVIWKYSRFARDIDDAQYYKSRLRRDGYEIYSVKDTIPDGINGRLFEAAIDWMNERFLEDLSSDVKRGLHHNLTQYGAIPGTPPRGFMRGEPILVGAHRDGSPHIVHRWVPDPELWDTCKLAWQLRAQGFGYTEIRKATGLYTSKTSFKHFFSNPIYIGEMHYGGRVIPHYVQPMIDRQTWETVQRLNGEHSSGLRTEASVEHPRRYNSSYCLSGLVRCAQCGSPMNGDTVVSRSKGVTNRYYACTNRKRQGGCTSRNIPAVLLEQAVQDTLIDYLSGPENLAHLTVLIETNRSQDAAQTDEKLSQIATKLAGIHVRLRNIADAIAESGHTSTLLKKLAELEEQEADLIAQRDSTAVPPEIPARTIEITAKKLSRTLQNASLKEKRRVYRGFIDHIVSERTDDTIQGLIVFYFPPDEDYAYNRSHLRAYYHRHKLKLTVPYQVQTKYSLPR